MDVPLLPCSYYETLTDIAASVCAFPQQSSISSAPQRQSFQHTNHFRLLYQIRNLERHCGMFTMK